MRHKSAAVCMAIGLAVLLLEVAPVLCQEAADAPSDPDILVLPETPVANAPTLVKSHVMMKGVASRYKFDPTTNASVYDLTDQYGSTLAVRGTDKQMALDQLYVIVGTLTQDPDGKLELVELGRRAAKTNKGQAEPPVRWNVKTNTFEDNAPQTPPEGAATKETESSDYTLYAIGGALILIAVVLGIVLAVRSGKQQQEAMALAQEEAERKRREMEAVARQGAWAAETSVGAGVTQLSPAAATTIEAWGTLEVVEGPDAGQRFPLAGTEVSIGRTDGDILVKGDHAISGRHARIVRTNDGGLRFVDESKNGSVVAGKPVHRKEAELTDGVEVQMGISRLVLKVLRAQPAPASPAAETTMFSVAQQATEMFTGCELSITEGSDAGQRVPLSAQRIVIGRGDEADVKLTDTSVSRKHAVLTFEHGDYTLHNESSQGTRVNGEKVEKHTLQDGDEVQMGPAKLTFTKLQ